MLSGGRWTDEELGAADTLEQRDYTPPPAEDAKAAEAAGADEANDEDLGGMLFICHSK